MLNNACSVPCFEHSGTLGNIRNAWEHKGSQRTNKRVVSQRVFQNPSVIGAISKHIRAWLVQCPPAHQSSSMRHFLGRAEGMCLRGPRRTAELSMDSTPGHHHSPGHVPAAPSARPVEDCIRAGDFRGVLKVAPIRLADITRPDVLPSSASFTTPSCRSFLVFWQRGLPLFEADSKVQLM